MSVDKVSVVIVGAGFMGRTHAGAYGKISRANLLGICDISEKARLEFSAEYGVKAYSSYEEVLSDEFCDAVDICLPTTLHEEYVMRAIDAGKAVFCEKPLTLSEESLRRILDRVKSSGSIFQVGQVVRFWPENEFVRNKIKDGSFGDVKVVTASRCSTHPAWSEWYRKPENSGGGLFDLHLHDLDYLVSLFGKVSSVYATGVKNSLGAWNHVESTLNFECGVKAVSESILEMPASFPFSTELKIVGSKAASVSKMRAGVNLEDVASAIRETYWYSDDKAERVELDYYDAYEKELEYFIESILTHDTVHDKVSTSSVAYSLSLIFAIRKSLESGEVVRL